MRIVNKGSCRWVWNSDRVGAVNESGCGGSPAVWSSELAKHSRNEAQGGP